MNCRLEDLNFHTESNQNDYFFFLKLVKEVLAQDLPNHSSQEQGNLHEQIHFMITSNIFTIRKQLNYSFRVMYYGTEMKS